MTLGERIYKLRTEKEMSQGDLADALEVSRQSISKWETNGSVPELDKLVKLSEIFGVSLDELILDKKQSEPVAEPEPKVIYVERVENRSPRKTAGVVLLCFAALVWLMCALLGGVLEGLVLAAPFAFCGLICMFVRKNVGLWCLWVVYLFIELYLRFATGINWMFVFLPQVYGGGHTIHLIVAWALWLSFIALTLFTILRFRKSVLTSVKHNAVPAALCWAVYLLLTWFGVLWPVRDDITDVDQIRVFSFVSAVTGWIRNIVFVAAVVFTVRLATLLWQKRKSK